MTEVQLSLEESAEAEVCKFSFSLSSYNYKKSRSSVSGPTLDFDPTCASDVF